MLVRAFSRRESRYSCVTSSSSSSSESSALCSDSDSEDEEKEDADELEDVDDLEEKFEGPSVSSESSGRNFPFPLCDIESAIGCCVTRGAEERAWSFTRPGFSGPTTSTCAAVANSGYHWQCKPLPEDF